MSYTQRLKLKINKYHITPVKLSVWITSKFNKIIARQPCMIRHMDVFEDRLELVGVGALPSRTIPLSVGDAVDAPDGN